MSNSNCSISLSITSSGTAFDTSVFDTLVFAKFCLSGSRSAETVAMFESSVDMCESSAVAVCDSSVTAVVCESSDVAAFETSIQRPESPIKSNVL